MNMENEKEKKFRKNKNSSICLLLFSMSILFCFLPFREAKAAEHYFENPEHVYEAFYDEIYNPEYKVKFGFAREGATVYSDWHGSSVAGRIEKFGGVIITSETESYAQVIYQNEGVYDIGWIEQSFYHEEVKFYNGAEKQLLADGIYKMESYNEDRTYYLELIFEGNQTYAIKSIKTGGYLEVKYDKDHVAAGLYWNNKNDSGAQDWKLIRAYDHFYVWNEDAQMYLVSKGVKALGLASIPTPLMNQFGKAGAEEAYHTAEWEFTRQFDKNVNPYRNFLQYDPDWANEEYGDVDGDYGGKMAAAGCGVVSITNMLYALTGEFIDPMLLAEFAVDNYYRVIGSGTDDEIYQAAAAEFGDAYHFRFIKRCYNVFEMRDYLKAGCVAVSYVPGHYVTIADYNEEEELYLVLDSHPIPRRPTSPWGDWFPWEKLESGGLQSSCYFIFERR